MRIELDICILVRRSRFGKEEGAEGGGGGQVEGEGASPPGDEFADVLAPFVKGLLACCASAMSFWWCFSRPASCGVSMGLADFCLYSSAEMSPEDCAMEMRSIACSRTTIHTNKQLVDVKHIMYFDDIVSTLTL